VRLIPDSDFLPVEFFGKGKFSGIATDYVEILQEKLGITFDIREVDSWSALVRQTEARENDVWSAVAVMPAREKYMLFSALYIELPVVIIVLDDIKDALSISKLKRLQVAVIKKYAIGAQLIWDNR